MKYVVKRGSRVIAMFRYYEDALKYTRSEVKKFGECVYYIEDIDTNDVIKTFNQS
jgi:hypothetical protein